ncbi:MAG: hypothetical protein E5X88_21040 [Mesorhizobium sp.]|uniref:hypothetical protein n=1 Tax=Mesorhizobium sp. TaxID=1871066 RepID=UPI001222B2CF|nr:hypothetical protein [Mesorhizobium sp.]TIO06903.1 MAG: hypothetical protein E5X88_21040 [Mesorhizobium sp.]
MGVVNKEIPLGSYTVSIESVRKIYKGLQRTVDEEADLALAKWELLPDQTKEQSEAQKKEVRAKAFKVTVSLYAEDGSRTYGETEEIFDLPEDAPFVTKIYMTNQTSFKAIANTNPANLFELMLDFSQPPLLDANNVVSSPTYNASKLTIGSVREGWLAGIEKIVLSHLDKRHRFRTRLHAPFAYDHGLIIFGFPLGFYACWLASDLVDKWTTNNQFLRTAAYVYIVVASLWVYRVLFGYTKWAFPLAELKEQRGRPKVHRAFWWGLVLLLAGKVFWDFFDPYLSISHWFGPPSP